MSLETFQPSCDLSTPNRGDIIVNWNVRRRPRAADTIEPQPLRIKRVPSERFVVRISESRDQAALKTNDGGAGGNARDLRMRAEHQICVIFVLQQNRAGYVRHRQHPNR